MIRERQRKQNGTRFETSKAFFLRYYVSTPTGRQKIAVKLAEKSDTIREWADVEHLIIKELAKANGDSQEPVSWSLADFVEQRYLRLVNDLAGLKGIPSVLYEAAKIDGAGPWSRLVSITIPMMAPTLLFNIVMGLVGSFQVFTSAYVLTSGGPANSTMFYILYLYQNAFQNFHMGLASAQAVSLLVITFGLSLLVVRFFGSRTYSYG